MDAAGHARHPCARTARGAERHDPAIPELLRYLRHGAEGARPADRGYAAAAQADGRAGGEPVEVRSRGTGASTVQGTRKVAIITGASRGIGAGLVAGYRQAGYAVVGVAQSMPHSGHD